MKMRKKGESRMTPRFPSWAFIHLPKKYLSNIYYLQGIPLNHRNPKIDKTPPQPWNDSQSSEEDREGDRQFQKRVVTAMIASHSRPHEKLTQSRLLPPVQMTINVFYLGGPKRLLVVQNTSENWSTEESTAHGFSYAHWLIISFLVI